MTDEQYIDITIDISKRAKYPYGAIVVKDGKITDIDELAKYGKAKMEIIKELHREKAVEVLKMRGENI